MSTPTFQDTTFGFIGCGNMAEALLRSVTQGGLIQPSQILASDPSPERRAIFTTLGCSACEDNGEVAGRSDVLILAVKPQVIESACQSFAEKRNPDGLVVSIAAGVDTARLESLFPIKPRLIRVMPNTPLMVGRGLTGVARGSCATEADAHVALQLFAAGGFAFEVAEEDLHAVTAMS
ncbi:MAG: pyrroline-5-carboxylate reductase family protein, partial [Planctomycetota bacterium]